MKREFIMSTSVRTEILRKIHAINTWKRGAIRAPHKRLLVLLGLARITGPPRRSVHTEYPFWRLQKDGLWDVPSGSALARRSSDTDPRKSELIKHDVVGGFPMPVYDRNFETT